MQLIKRKKIKAKFSRFNIYHKPFHGKDGIDGARGQVGEPGASGTDGISVIDAIKLDNHTFKLKFSNGKFSQQLAIPEAINGRDGEDGAPGKEGGPGAPGKTGKNAKEIVDIKIFSRRIIFVFDDGSEKSVALKFPQGTVDNPGLGMGGGGSGVMGGEGVDDIIGINPIVVQETQPHTFIISLDQSEMFGLPFYKIESGLDIVVPLNRQHLTFGGIDIEGELTIDGQVVVL